MRDEKPIIYTSRNYLYSKVEAIKELLNRNGEFLENNNLLALYGEWGSGKSSVFKTLKKDLKEDDNFKNEYIPLIFEAWRYERDSNLPLSLYDFILDNIINDKKAFFNVLKEGVREGLISGLRSIVGTINFSYGSMSVDLSKPLDNKAPIQSTYTLTENFIDDFQKQINKYRKDKKIIVFIDDLDRCDDENIINLLSTLKLMFAVKNIIFVCGIDKKAVIATLSNKYNSEEKAEKYLEKIFPIYFNIEGVSYEKIILESISSRKLDLITGLKITNPRKINRILNKYKMLIQVINIEQYECFEEDIKYYIFLKVVLKEASEYVAKNNKLAERRYTVRYPNKIDLLDEDIEKFY